MRAFIGVAALAVLSMVTAREASAQTLRWSAPTDIVGMDPYSHTESFTTSMLHHVFDPLVRRGRTLQLEPALAVSWTNPAPDRWRVELR